MTGLQAGWARAEITPPLGSRLRGYYTERHAEGVHDPLHARALMLADGDERLAVVSCDIVALDRAVTARARELAQAACGLPPERLILHATHTHLGPFSNEHVEFLAQRIALAVEQASHVAPASLRTGRGQEDSVAFCRRFRMADGSIKMNPGRGNPDIVEPSAPIDPRVDVVELTAGPRRLVVVNYALHLDTVGGCRMSADYPFYLERLLRRAYGADTELLFLQGTSGDINHIDVNHPQPTGFAMAKHIGLTLGAEVLKVLASAREVAGTPLRVASRRVPFEVGLPTEAEVAAAREAQATAQRGSLNPALVQSGRTLKLAARGEATIHVEVGAATFGDLALATFPGEMFCAFGRRLKDSAPRQTLVAELCYDDLSYIPTADEAGTGGYEAWANLLPPGAGDRIVDTALELLAGQVD